MKKNIKRFLRKIKNLLAGNSKTVVVKVSQLDYNKALAGKKILVTGGSSGIGYAIAKKCVAEGAKVVITGRDEGKLQTACKKINSSNIMMLVWDVADSQVSKKMIDETDRLLDGIDIVFNNAGIYSFKGFLEVDEESWDKVLDINAKGLFFVCQAISAYYINKKRTGKIINIASNRGVLGAHDPYGMSKWGVYGLTKGLGKALISKGIIVNGIAPGTTATAINGIDVEKNAFSSCAPNNRVALPEEIAELAVFLASDAANNIVGQVIICDGGESLV